MKEIIAFDVFEAFDKQTITVKNVNLSDDELYVTGRACTDLSIGDILLTNSGNKVTVLEIYSYGYRFETISSVMSCGIIIKKIDECLNGQKLKLVV